MMAMQLRSTGNFKESSTIEGNTKRLKYRDYDRYQGNITENVHYITCCVTCLSIKCQSSKTTIALS